MGKCSYIWKEKDEKLIKSIKKSCSYETWEGSDEFCIFHDPSSNKDRDLFIQKLEEQIQSETEKHSFHGCIFPKNWDYFKNYEFKINVDFRKTTFQDADFSEATFQDADFSEATFKDANFWKATFKDANFIWIKFYDAFFRGATFQNAYFLVATFWDADFSEATFQNAYFTGATFKDTYFKETAFQENADFSKAIFQENGDFTETTFQNANFSEATFQAYADFNKAAFKDAYFEGATFQGDADFSGAIFEGIASFMSANFQRIASFAKAIFQKNAYFEGTTFQNTDFSQAIFHDLTMNETVFRENLEFKPKQVKNFNLRNSKFFFMGTITADLKMARFYSSFIKNVSFIDCQWPDDKIIFEEEHMKDEDINLGYKELETIYRNLKQNMQNYGDYSLAGEFYFREMEMRRKKNKWKTGSWWWLQIYKFLAGYGEKPHYTAAVSGYITILFAFLYGLFGCIQYSAGNPCLTQKIIDTLYFSFVTFTTLGLGDIRPITTIGKALICCEAIIGAFMMALFVVVFVRKMAR